MRRFSLAASASFSDDIEAVELPAGTFVDRFGTAYFTGSASNDASDVAEATTREAPRLVSFLIVGTADAVLAILWTFFSRMTRNGLSSVGCVVATSTFCCVGVGTVNGSARANSVWMIGVGGTLVVATPVLVPQF